MSAVHDSMRKLIAQVRMSIRDDTLTYLAPSVRKYNYIHGLPLRIGYQLA